MTWLTKEQLLLLYATRLAQNAIVIRTHCPTLKVEVVRFPRLIRDLLGKVMDSGEFIEREVTICDHKWFERTNNAVIAQAQVDAARVLLAQGADPAEVSEEEVLRQLVYLEDQQMCGTMPFVFETDCPWTLKELSELSWQIFEYNSVSFESFHALLVCNGFKCLLVDLLNVNDTPPMHLGVVEGAVGTY